MWLRHRRMGRESKRSGADGKDAFSALDGATAAGRQAEEGAQARRGVGAKIVIGGVGMGIGRAKALENL